MRYCCEDLKEVHGEGRVVLTGVRWAESNNRRNNQGLITFTNKGARKKVQEFAGSYSKTLRGGVVLNDDNDETRRAVEQCYRTKGMWVDGESVFRWWIGDAHKQNDNQTDFFAELSENN